MPTYEFRCPAGHDFEKLYRTISGAPSQAECPVCGKASERIMSASGFAFKGSGFYLTDYGKDAHRTKGPTEQKPAAASSGGEGGSSGGGSSSGEGGSSGGGSSSGEGGSSGGGDSKSADAKAKPASTPAAAPAPAAPSPPKAGGSE